MLYFSGSGGPRTPISSIEMNTGVPLCKTLGLGCNSAACSSKVMHQLISPPLMFLNSRHSHHIPAQAGLVMLELAIYRMHRMLRSLMKRHNYRADSTSISSGTELTHASKKKTFNFYILFFKLHNICIHKWICHTVDLKHYAGD